MHRWLNAHHGRSTTANYIQVSTVTIRTLLILSLVWIKLRVGMINKPYVTCVQYLFTKLSVWLKQDTDISQFFTVCRNEYNTRGHRFRLLATRANKDTRHYFYSLRVVRVWNSLPDDTDFSSLLGFKKSLYCANLQNFCIVCYWTVSL